jgi:peptide-methionine (S)-S-oxide reductase
MEKATFGAGCFWGVEETFHQLKGVLNTEVGYAGGVTQRPSYEQVCSHTTGHAEVVQVTFDPSKISYEDLLATFWQCHNPTTLNRQGPDVGSQYRSVIFYHSSEQKQKAEASKKKLQTVTSSEIVTEIVPATPFYKAEEYHQRYIQKHSL